MSPTMILLLLSSLVAPGVDNELSYQRAYKTEKKVPEIQKCLIGQLADMGEQTIMQMGDGVILMIREGQDRPLLIEIAPPAVTITTPSSLDVRNRVQRCV
jgi:hypothetical protein